MFMGGHGVACGSTTRSVAEGVGTRWRWPGLRNGLWERKGVFSENVITDSHLLSFLGGRDCSNAVRGKEKRQRCGGRPDLVGREAQFDRGTGRWPFASSARRKALSWGGIRDWE